MVDIARNRILTVTGRLMELTVMMASGVVADAADATEVCQVPRSLFRLALRPMLFVVSTKINVILIC